MLTFLLKTRQRDRMKISSLLLLCEDMFYFLKGELMFKKLLLGLGLLLPFSTPAYAQLYECKRMALTFDDGPLPASTPLVLKVLSEHNIQATFFMVGKNVRAFPKTVQQVVDQGHELGVHGDTHADLTKISSSSANWELQKSTESLWPYQQNIHYWRAPYGNVPMHLTYPSSVGLRHLGWTIDSLDWKREGVLAQVNRVVPRFHNGAIILFHDHVSYTPDALAIIIHQAWEQGYVLGKASSLGSLCTEEEINQPLLITLHPSENNDAPKFIDEDVPYEDTNRGDETFYEKAPEAINKVY